MTRGGEEASSAPVRLLALDIDGTLLHTDRTISDRTRRALDAARDAGARLVLVTGRRLPSARQVARDLGGDVPMVLHNGALIVEGGEILRSRPLPRAVARRAVGLGLERGEEPVLHCGARGEGRVVAREEARASLLVRYYLERSTDGVTLVSDLLGPLDDEDPMQVMFGGPVGPMDDTRKALMDLLGDEARIEQSVYPATDRAILEVLNPAVGKAGAVAFLQERWGVAPEETLAVGDNWNDREMIERAGRGFVMGNAPPELRELGHPVLPGNDEDGVAHAIEAHVLSGHKKRG